ncbi:hypothetical protein QOT17_020998 [Balamuthia mandrillaris]
MAEIPDELVLKILTVVARPVWAIDAEGVGEEGFLVAAEHLAASLSFPMAPTITPAAGEDRHQHMALQSWDDAPIERCSWIKKCPMSWVGNFNSLQEGSSPTTKYCDTCKKEVHWVSNQPELELAAAKGLCVAFGPPLSSSDAEVEYYELVGFADPDYY